ncbi:MAG TPA: transporter, partial [Tepidisphaeraceae bacterium]|nr:transporter [Tepidisphaeraceae bacterium]
MPRRRKHFRSNGIAAIVTAVAVVHLLAATAFADETSATSKPIAAPASKWQYNLFNPTPPDQMRGMDTDRPNFTNTPHTVDAGHLQIETGLFDYVNSFDHTGGTTLRGNDYAVGQFNFRLGVLNNLEMNVVINSYQLDQTRDEVSRASTRVDGFGDTFFGGKLNLWGNEGGDEVWATGFALQPQLKFPTANSDIGNGRFEFSFNAPLL